MRSLLVWLLLFAPLVLAADRPHLVIVAGDHEYSGEQTLPLLARALEERYGFRCTVLKSQPDQNGEEDIPGLAALAQADVAMFYLRWRRLPPEQLAHIESYLKSGKPVFGWRTTSHPFNYPKGHALEAWNAWGAEAFGTPPGWGKEGHTHYGHNSSTDVTVAAGVARHPILRGVAPAFHVRSWLYRVQPPWPPAGATVLLTGAAVNPNKPAETNPVAWTWTNRHGGRTFYTSLGHPEDLAQEPVQRLTVNALFWLLNPRHAPKPRWAGRMAIDIPYRGMVNTQ
ncbi:MAG: ThuA domain-containing protein [Bryobacterales bacterium]|nr:ThuA domain-containing protein [Bryobacterales bacterium]